MLLTSLSYPLSFNIFETLRMEGQKELQQSFCYLTMKHGSATQELSTMSPYLADSAHHHRAGVELLSLRKELLELANEIRVHLRQPLLSHLVDLHPHPIMNLLTVSWQPSRGLELTCDKLS